MINKVSSGECFFTYPGILLLLLHCFQLGSKKGTHRQQRPQLKIIGYVKKHSPEETHLLIMQWHAIRVWNLLEYLPYFLGKIEKLGASKNWQCQASLSLIFAPPHLCPVIRARHSIPWSGSEDVCIYIYEKMCMWLYNSICICVNVI